MIFRKAFGVFGSTPATSKVTTPDTSISAIPKLPDTLGALHVSEQKFAEMHSDFASMFANLPDELKQVQQLLADGALSYQHLKNREYITTRTTYRMIIGMQEYANETGQRVFARLNNGIAVVKPHMTTEEMDALMSAQDAIKES